MPKEEFYSLDEIYKEKDPAEVKQLISEGALMVFRQQDEVKLKPALNIKSANKSRMQLRSDEQRYYTASCKKFREENWGIMAISAFMAGMVLLSSIFFPKASGLSGDSTENVYFVCVSLLGIGEFFFLASCFLCVISNAFLSKFIVYLHYKDTQDKELLLSFFQKGAIRKQFAQIFCIVAIGSIVLFLFASLAQRRLALVFALLFIFLCVAFGIYTLAKQKTKEIEEKAQLNTNTQERKHDTDENLLLSSVLAILKSSTPKVRQEAVKVLGKLGTSKAINTLVTTLGDPAPEVRARAIAVLGNMGEKNVLEALKCLLHDEVAEVRAAIAEALGNLQDEDSLEILRGTLEDEMPEVRGAAAEALGKLNNKRAVRFLLNTINDDDWFVRHKTIVALGKLKNFLTFDPVHRLIQAMNDKHEYVALAARHVLQKLVEQLREDDPLYEEIRKALAAEEEKELSDIDTSKVISPNQLPNKENES